MPKVDWYKYQDKDCQVSFPKIPKNDTLVKETAAGKLIVHRLILFNNRRVNDSNLVYELIESSYPSPGITDSSRQFAESVFKGAVNASLKQLNGRLVSEKDIRMGAFYGKDVTIKYDNDTKLARMKCYVAKEKMYAIETVAPFQKAINSNAETFFESFKIK
ncbi:MAG: hypothetical protein ACTHOB_18385 [Ginsengibacter sp.]